jgi:serine/threonine protein kinase
MWEVSKRALELFCFCKSSAVNRPQQPVPYSHSAAHPHQALTPLPPLCPLPQIVTGERPQRGSLRMPRVPEECPQEVSDLIMQCLSEEPCERPTAAQLLKTLSGMLERSKTAAHSAHSAHRAAAATDAGAQEQVSPPVSPSAGWPETPR